MFRTITLIAVVFGMVPSTVPNLANASPPSVIAQSADAAQIRSLAEGLMQAIVVRDATALNTLLADDFVDVSSGGSISNRSQFIAEYEHPAATATKFESAEIDQNETIVRVHSDTAVFTTPITWRGTTGSGQEFVSTLSTTMVALKTEGVWRILSTHSSLVP